MCSVEEWLIPLWSRRILDYNKNYQDETKVKAVEIIAKPTLDLTIFPENIASSVNELIAHLEQGKLQEAIVSMQQIKSHVSDIGLY